MTEEETILQLQKELQNMRVLLTDTRLASLEKSRDEHDKRIRMVEEVATKFNFLMSLSIGGGALSAIVLLKSLLGF